MRNSFVIAIPLFVLILPLNAAGDCFCLMSEELEVWFDCIEYKTRRTVEPIVTCYSLVSDTQRRRVPDAASLTRVPASKGICRPCHQTARRRLGPDAPLRGEGGSAQSGSEATDTSSSAALESEAGTRSEADKITEEDLTLLESLRKETMSPDREAAEVLERPHRDRAPEPPEMNGSADDLDPPPAARHASEPMVPVEEGPIDGESRHER